MTSLTSGRDRASGTNALMAVSGSNQLQILPHQRTILSDSLNLGEVAPDGGLAAALRGLGKAVRDDPDRGGGRADPPDRLEFLEQYSPLGLACAEDEVRVALVVATQRSRGPPPAVEATDCLELELKRVVLVGHRNRAAGPRRRDGEGRKTGGEDDIVSERLEQEPGSRRPEYAQSVGSGVRQLPVDRCGHLMGLAQSPGEHPGPNRRAAHVRPYVAWDEDQDAHQDLTAMGRPLAFDATGSVSTTAANPIRRCTRKSPC